MAQAMASQLSAMQAVHQGASADEVADLVGGQKRLAGPAGEPEVKRVCVEEASV